MTPSTADDGRPTARPTDAGEPTVDDPVTQMGYEQARDELAEVVRRLESGGLSLDESVALWERGEALATRCEEQLAGARERVQRVLDAADDTSA
jgi:exodeoxyribonuclease VII small subunit